MTDGMVAAATGVQLDSFRTACAQFATRVSMVFAVNALAVDQIALATASRGYGDGPRTSPQRRGAPTAGASS